MTKDWKTIFRNKLWAVPTTNKNWKNVSKENYMETTFIPQVAAFVAKFAAKRLFFGVFDTRPEQTFVSWKSSKFGLFKI